MPEEKSHPRVETEEFSRMRSVRSKTGAGEVNYINSSASNSDKALLAEIGYKEELKRTYSTLQVFGLAFSIMGLLPSISSVMAGGLTGGPVTLVWGWFVAGLFLLLSGITMAESASAIPTAGGLYYWTHYYAPEKYKTILSFVIGCSNSLSLTAGMCSITYGFSEEILAAVAISKDGNFDITNGKVYGIFAAGVVGMGLCTCFASSITSKIQAFSILSNLFIIALLFIALPIGTKINKGSFNGGSFIFARFENLSDWNDGWQFCLAGFMPVVWTIGGFDSCVHQSEEAKDAKRAVPIGIVGSITVCWILGWLILIVLMACCDQDMETLIDNPYGFVMAQIIYTSLGKNWTIAFMSLIAFCQFLMGCSIVIASSRQFWAFARDDGLPFSQYIKKVSQKLSIPTFAIVAACCCALVLGLLCLIGSTAANALFSLGVAGNNLAWCTPTILRLTCGRDLFTPGPFHLGKYLSPIVNWTSAIFQIFIIVLVMFPASQHGVERDTMNYACVIAGGVWILSACYYVAYKKRYFHGPKSNLNEEEYLEALEVDNLDAIFSPSENKKD